MYASGRHHVISFNDLRPGFHANSASSMLTVSSSSESSIAPTDFNICHSLENSLQYTTPPAARCQLCQQMRRRFYCADCVRLGDITHSKAKLPQRFSEKKLRLSTSERDRHSLAALVEEASFAQRQRDELRQRIELTRQAVEARRIVVQNLEREIAAAKEDMAKMRNGYRQARLTRQKLPERKKACDSAIQKSRKAINSMSLELASLRERVGVQVRQQVEVLRTCIFPIEMRCSSKEPELEGPLAELEEACRTNYIRGRWVYSSHSVDATYSIGEPCLSADGNYGHLIEWVQQRQEQQTALAAGSDESSHAAFEAAAGFMHLAQMVKVLAFYLDLKLPYALCFSEFAIETLTEEGLRNKVARLNANVVFICASQHVDSVQIRPKQTIRNLLSILDVVKRDTPRSAGFEMSSELALSVEDALTQHLCLFDVHAEMELLGRTGAERERDSPDDDWEAVASLGPTDMSHGMQNFSSASGSVISRNRSASVSLFSSAAAYVNNFWSTSSRPE
ncbi:beclin 1-associated autophagy-related key regulator-like [Tropilaelaps mercedesae]|uniref:Beclin 1-associated autophagy-related key regulator-like n=1 Tax=Tropilaelaps mercedesae TaxID=418985 RepID=A0A1V9XLW1_9ACAR|nr:beclin 1-associated autophagy-related key regulator-like [Tropilaelaps mercedesae]